MIMLVTRNNTFTFATKVQYSALFYFSVASDTLGVAHYGCSIVKYSHDKILHLSSNTEDFCFHEFSPNF